VIKKPRTRGGYGPARGLQNTNPQWVAAPERKKGRKEEEDQGLPNESFGTQVDFDN